MRVQRPVLNEKNINAFLEGASSHPKASLESTDNNGKEISSCNNSLKQKKKSPRRNSACPLPVKQKPIGKFMVEMPTELRKRIKFKSVADGVSMNELIVVTLQQRFR